MTAPETQQSLPDGVSKCNTCRAAFPTVERVKEHYRSEWHVLNSKRRANGLPPLTRDEFKVVAPKRKVVAKQAAQPPLPTESENTKGVDDSAPADVGGSTAEGAAIEERLEKGVEEDIVEVEELPIGPNVSIFDNKEFETTDDCIEYMASKFGFFIPDVEYLVDLDGLLTYLGEKVKLGGICLYCQKQMRPGRPCQSHMISTSHCKIAFEEEIDLDEYEDFYDYTSSYEDMPVGENGEIVERSIELNKMGELVLLDGRTVGHRAFRVYYKQHFKPEEARPSILAQQREELLRLGSKFGGNKVSSTDLINMSDTEVMSMLVRYHKEVRRGQMVEQRSHLRKQMVDQRREYRSNVAKLRSSETTTAKIRDYHGMLM